MRKHKKILLVAIFAILLIFGSVVYATTETTISAIPEKSAEFEAWENLSDEERAETIQPTYYTTEIKDAIKRSTYNTYTQLLKASSNTESSYSLLDNIALNVKNQQQTGNCWAFSFTSMLESVMSNKYGKTNLIYSPMHIDYQASSIYNKVVGEGGTQYMAIAYSISGYGPVNEEDFTFESVYDETNNDEDSYYLKDISEVNLNQTAQLRIDDVTYFPAIYKSYSDTSVIYKDSSAWFGYTTYSESEVEAIRELVKESIKSNGAVSATLAYSSMFGPSTYYNEDTYAFYNNSSLASANHAVTIIGWDDNYAITNFNEDYRPLNPGAWIVLNSWGTDFGEDGIFYVSYDDAIIESSMISVNEISDFENDSSDVYDNLYEYDNLGVNFAFYGINDEGTAYLDSAYIANVYTRTDTSVAEYINEVGIYLLETSGVEIYVNSEDDDCSNLELVASYTGSNALESGYHTIKLSSPKLLTGEKFVIAINYINSEKVTIPIECDLYASGLSTTSTVYDTATSNKGECFYSKDGTTWQDIDGLEIDEYTIADTSTCAKAFTVVTGDFVHTTGITLNKSNVEITKGQTTTLTATITPADATNQNVKWTSSNESVATVSSTGVVTAVSAGSAVITATSSDGNYTATATITVTASATEDAGGTTTDTPNEDDTTTQATSVTGVTLNISSLAMAVGETSSALVVTITPSNASNLSVTWTSSNESVATISQTGIITAVSAGTTTITVTTSDGSYTATCTVTVTEKTNSDDDIYTTESEIKLDTDSGSESGTTATSNTDTTVATGTLPQTGVNSIIIIAIMVAVIATAAIVKIKSLKYKDIK